ncbi:hypothetical protein E2C01_003099 [Portunus trituberculatus]|uniref:Uncharacterized protein n=1 Tax=Portunus trituberculatus TaxID=210409 RepID=A0A5B7CSL4_PORTR|nr:hypothetical protein [Portunus trituberculatus]
MENHSALLMADLQGLRTGDPQLKISKTPGNSGKDCGDFGKHWSEEMLVVEIYDALRAIHVCYSTSNRCCCSEVC